MVFVVGCLVAIVVISIIGSLWDQGNKSALPSAPARSLPPAPVTPSASQKTAAPLEVKVKTKTPQRQIWEWMGEYNYADLSTLSGVNANYGGYEGPLLERVLDVPHAGYSKILCYAAEGTPRELDAQDAPRHWIIAIKKEAARFRRAMADLTFCLKGRMSRKASITWRASRPCKRSVRSNRRDRCARGAHAAPGPPGSKSRPASHRGMLPIQI